MNKRIKKKLHKKALAKWKPPYGLKWVTNCGYDELHDCIGYIVKGEPKPGIHSVKELESYGMIGLYRPTLLMPHELAKIPSYYSWQHVLDKI